MSETKRFKSIGKNAIREDAFDKLTGKAVFGADVKVANTIHGVMLRSPHAHAKILSIDTAEAEALDGVYAVVTAEDFPELGYDLPGHISRDNIARRKVLYHGHGVVGIVARTEDIALRARELIKVEYEKLPHALTLDDAIAEDAPIIHDHLKHEGDSEGRPSNVYEKIERTYGDPEKGFAEADVVRERTYFTPFIHQAYIEPVVCTASYSANSQSTIWTTTQGHFQIREFVAKMTGMTERDINVVPTEIGGGFGGKTMPYLEAIALMLSKKAGRPVKMRMTREEVLRCAGPVCSAKVRVKIGIKRDGTITALSGHMLYDSGALPGVPASSGVRNIFTAYDVKNAYIEAYSVVTNKTRSRAYRAPGGPQACFAMESLLNEVADEIGMDPIEVRLKNAIRDNGENISKMPFKEAGLVKCLEAARDSDHYQSELKPGCGRAVSAAYWFNAGGISAATVTLHKNGYVSVTTGSADLSGTRTTLAQIAAEAFEVPVEQIHAEVADTNHVGFTGVSGGSRTVNATGQAVNFAAIEVIEQMKQRAASGWNVTPDDVQWKEGVAINSKNPDETLTIGQIGDSAAATGGPISSSSSVNIPGGIGPCFAVHICDVEVDKETGKTKLLRYTAIQDAGLAVHPQMVEGQMQGGAVQGIGWALNEECIYNADGVLQNPGFLDYRIPLASDLPMIETIIVEVPNSMHPFGVRGVGEAPIIPPLAAVGSAISNAIGAPVTELPASPPRVLSLTLSAEAGQQQEKVA